MKKIIDLSIAIENEIVSDPIPYKPKIEYMKHKDTFGQLEPFFPGLKQEDLPDGEACAVEKIELNTHNGTHLDAPYHFHSTMNNGKQSTTIDKVPLEWCYQRGVKLDFRHFEDGYLVTPEDIQSELNRIGVTLQPLDIVVINTSAGAAYGQDNFIHKGCGVGKAGTLWLLEQGIKITGTDAWSWDAPFFYTAKKYAETGDASLIWEGHKTGKDMEYCHLEKLQNLDQLPATGFSISCFPVKIKNASAGWTRAVAIMD